MTFRSKGRFLVAVTLAGCLGVVAWTLLAYHQVRESLARSRGEAPDVAELLDAARSHLQRQFSLSSPGGEVGKVDLAAGGQAERCLERLAETLDGAIRDPGGDVDEGASPGPVERIEAFLRAHADLKMRTRAALAPGRSLGDEVRQEWRDLSGVFSELAEDLAEACSTRAMRSEAIAESRMWRVALWSTLCSVIVLIALIWGFERWLSPAAGPSSEGVVERPADRSGDERGVARRDAIETSQLKSEFIANVSHELRTPLNGVLGMLELLRSTDLDNEQIQYADAAYASGESLLGLINNILDFSAIGSGQIEFSEIRFNLRACVYDVVELLGHRAQDREIDVACLLRAELPEEVIGDPAKLRQILTNLVANAIKFNRAGGDVLVTVSLQERVEDGAVVRFDVTDTGIGVDEEDRTRIFEEFQQADASLSRNFGGTGLGLAVSRCLVEAAGGEISVESELGEGSTFSFSLSFRISTPEAWEAEPREELAGLRVLVVDESVTNRMVLAYLLERWGVLRNYAVGIEEALAQLYAAANSGTPFDLVIMDRMDRRGLELARRIQADARIRAVRRILLTSLGRRGEAAEARGLGIQGYLTKPVRATYLHECLATVMGLKEEEDSPIVTRYSIEESRLRRRARILVAEDNVLHQRVAVEVLRQLGHYADVVDNGEQAVLALKRQTYDLVLMDCSMPRLDGFEATRRIRESESGVRLPIIALTGHSDPGQWEKCLLSGMDDYMVKPVDSGVLAEKLNTWLSVPDRAISLP